MTQKNLEPMSKMTKQKDSRTQPRIGRGLVSVVSAKTGATEQMIQPCSAEEKGHRPSPSTERYRSGSHQVLHLAKLKDTAVSTRSDQDQETDTHGPAVRAALLEYNEVLRVHGDTDPEPYVAKCPEEHQEEARGLLNTARLLKRAWKA